MEKMAGAKVSATADGGMNNKQPIEVEHIRTLFPESWIWEESTTGYASRLLALVSEFAIHQWQL